MNREQKEAVVAELATELGEAEAIFAVDYRGISVPQAAELRAELRNADTAFRVVKNRLTLRAADKAGTEPLKDWLDGPTALALVRGDAAAAAKTLSRLGGEFDVLDFKGGLMDGEVLEADKFKAIAKLPGRDQLNAQFAGIVASPLTGLVRGLGSMISGLALQLGQIAEQGLVTGEPPAPEPEEEAPKEPSADAPEPDGPAGEAEEPSVGAEQPPADDGEAVDREAEEEAPKEDSPEAEGEDSASPAPEASPATPAGEAEEVAEIDGEAVDPPAEAPDDEKTAPTADAADEETTEDTKEDD